MKTCRHHSTYCSFPSCIQILICVHFLSLLQPIHRFHLSVLCARYIRTTEAIDFVTSPSGTSKKIVSTHTESAASQDNVLSFYLEEEKGGGSVSVVLTPVTIETNDSTQDVFSVHKRPFHSQFRLLNQIGQSSIRSSAHFF